MVAAVIGLVVLPGAPAGATPTYSTSTTVCTVTDPRINEGSGMVLRGDGFDVINDGGDVVQVFHLDRACAVTGLTTASLDPFDTEDLATGPDGRLWVGDIGDNDQKRESVAVEIIDGTVEDASGSALLRRFTYPDGPHDAEALIVDPAGRIVIVTKEFLGGSGVYSSTDPVDVSPDGSSDPVALVKVGVLQLEVTNTPGGPIGLAGNLTVTGAATTADHSLVALRTYTDAYVWSVPAISSIAQTLTDDAPVRSALPEQPQGEAIALAGDGTMYLYGEGVGQQIVGLAPTGEAPPASGTSRPTTVPATPSAEPDARNAAGGSTGQVIGIGAVAAVALAVLVLMVIRRPSRRRRTERPD